jgi:uncharacterized protein (TIGR02265 family)
MSFDQAELEQRLALASQGQTTRGFVFKAATRELGRLCGVEAATQLQADVWPKGWTDFANYPIAGFLQLLFGATNAITVKGGTREEALRKLGAATTELFFSSSAGKILLTLFLHGGAEQLLANVAPAYGLSVNYGKRSYERRPGGPGVLHFSGDMMPPAYHEGILMAGFKAIKLDARVVGQARSLTEVDYVVTLPAVAKAG